MGEASAKNKAKKDKIFKGTGCQEFKKKLEELKKKFDVPVKCMAAYMFYVNDVRPALLEQARKEFGDGGGKEGNLKRMTWVGRQAAEQWAKADDATKAKYEAQRGAEKHAEAVKAYEESGRKAEYEKAYKEAIKARKEEVEQKKKNKKTGGKKKDDSDDDDDDDEDDDDDDDDDDSESEEKPKKKEKAKAKAKTTTT